MNRYRFRTVDCPDCFMGRYEIPSGPGYVSCECEECEGTGELDASCAECQRIEPISDDGLCEQCVDACSLPLAEYQAKYLLTECVGDPLLKRRAA